MTDGRPIYINGRFVSQPRSGIQRFAAEVVKQLDVLIGEAAADGRPMEVTLLLQPGTEETLPLRHIAIETVGRRHGHLWEQIDLARHARGGLLLNLNATGPVVHRNQIVTIHDACVFSMPSNYSFLFGTLYRTLVPILGRRARRIFTVSRFAKQDLIRHCGFPAEKIEVIYHGADHMRAQAADPSVLRRYGVEPGKYVLGVGLLTKGKNFGLVLEALHLLGDPTIEVVKVGPFNPKVFTKTELNFDGTLHELGYVSDDAVLRALYENAMCFVFPSIYESFGIPPIEAMSCGCPVIVADTTALPEVCGEAALYCDPYDPKDLAEKIGSLATDPQLRRSLGEAGLKHAENFTWRRCAEPIFAAISDLSRN